MPGTLIDLFNANTYIVSKFILDPNEELDQEQCSQNNVFIYVLSGSCVIDTIYHDVKNTIHKTQDETYNIHDTVWYSIKNDTDIQCVFLKITTR